MYPVLRKVCFVYRALIAGGGAPEIELALRLAEHSQTLAGKNGCGNNSVFFIGVNECRPQKL